MNASQHGLLGILGRVGLLAMVCLASRAGAETELMGTVEMTVDGVEQTFYVLDPGEGMQSGTVWVAMGPDEGALSIVAYDRASVTFVYDEAARSPVPAGDAAALVFSIGFSLEASAVSHELPVQPPAGPASVLLLENWSEPLDAYDMSGDPGEIRLTRIEARRDGSSRFAGTFRGVLRHDSGDTRTVDGRFDVQRVPFFDPSSLRE